MSREKQRDDNNAEYGKNQKIIKRSFEAIIAVSLRRQVQRYYGNRV